MDRYRTTETCPVTLHPTSVASPSVTDSYTANAATVKAQRLRLRGRYAALTRSRPADDPELLEVRAALALDRIGTVISEDGHHLTDADRLTLAQHLLPGVTGV